MKWFRLYSAVLHDPKVQRLSPAMFKHWINLLCLASAQDELGLLPSTEDIAFALRVQPAAALQIMTRFRRLGLVDQTEDGRDVPHNWTRRQRASDDVALRVREHRERKAGKIAESQGNVTLPITLPKRSVETEAETERDEYRGKAGEAPSRACGVTPEQAQAPEPPCLPVPRVVPLKPVNPHWDALVESLGVDPSSLTRTQRSNYGRAVKELKEARASPDEVRVRIARMLRHNQRQFVTVNFVVAHWAEYVQDLSRHQTQEVKNGRVSGSRRDSSHTSAGYVRPKRFTQEYYDEAERRMAAKQAEIERQFSRPGVPGGGLGRGAANAATG